LGPAGPRGQSSSSVTECGFGDIGVVNKRRELPQSFDSTTLVGMATLITGSCLCGGVRFEIARAVGPFELCHCGRCRKASGSAFVAGLGVLRDDFRLLQGSGLVKKYEAPVREIPPAYRRCFCSRCGSPVPDPFTDSPWLE